MSVEQLLRMFLSVHLPTDQSLTRHLGYTMRH